MIGKPKAVALQPTAKPKLPDVIKPLADLFPKPKPKPRPARPQPKVTRPKIKAKPLVLPRTEPTKPKLAKYKGPKNTTNPIYDIRRRSKDRLSHFDMRTGNKGRKGRLRRPTLRKGVSRSSLRRKKLS